MKAMTGSETAQELYEAAERYLAANPLPDPARFRPLLEALEDAVVQIEANGSVHRKPDVKAMRELAERGRQAYEDMIALKRSSPLPDAKTLEELAARHNEFLDELDEQYGQPSPET